MSAFIKPRMRTGSYITPTYLHSPAQHAVYIVNETLILSFMEAGLLTQHVHKPWLLRSKRSIVL